GLAEADARRGRARAPATQRDVVAVLQKAARLAAGESEGLPTALRQLQQRAGLLGPRAGLRAGPQQVPTAQVAAIDGVMGDQLRDAPIAVAEIAARDALGGT